jgi:hypothetical protein
MVGLHMFALGWAVFLLLWFVLFIAAYADQWNVESKAAFAWLYILFSLPAVALGGRAFIKDMAFGLV